MGQNFSLFFGLYNIVTIGLKTPPQQCSDFWLIIYDQNGFFVGFHRRLSVTHLNPP